MAIGSQFAGLDMKNLIGGPLSASAEASVTLAQSTADFINKVGFNSDKTARTIEFKFHKSDTDSLGNPINSEMSMEVPLLAIVPIPNLQIDEVNILFDMEVKECEKSESSLDAGGSFKGEANLGFFKVSVSGSVSSHSSNTRSTDNSAKYHVDVRAANHGTPEGLARVLDIMAATVAPTVLSSKMVDGDGKEVDSATKQKRLAQQASYERQQKLGTACKAASDIYETSLRNLKDLITSKNNAEKVKVQRKTNALPEGDEKAPAYVQMAQDINESWNRVSNEVRKMIESVYDQEALPKMKELFEMKKVDETDMKLLAVEEADVSTLQTGFEKAAKEYKSFKDQEKSLNDERSNYNELLIKK